jgi:hypothetical protein
VNELIAFALTAVKRSFDNLSSGEETATTGEDSSKETGGDEAEPEKQAPSAKPAPSKATTASQRSQPKKAFPATQKPQPGKKHKDKRYHEERNLVFKAEPEALKKLKEEKEKEAQHEEQEPSGEDDSSS